MQEIGEFIAMLDDLNMEEHKLQKDKLELDMKIRRLQNERDELFDRLTFKNGEYDRANKELMERKIVL